MFLVLNPEALEPGKVRLPPSPENADVPLDIELDVVDRKRNYDNEYGYGFFISEYLYWLCQITGIHPDDEEQLDDSSFDAIRDDNPALGAKLIAFTNEWYEYWRDHVVVMVDEEKAEREVRESLCNDCEEDHAWDVTYGTYDGDDPDDVSDDEDVTMNGLSLLERVAIIRRNRVRRELHDRLDQDREDAENEEVSREFVCRRPCDQFYEDKSNAEEETRNAKTDWLNKKWRKPNEQAERSIIHSELLGSFHVEDSREKPIYFRSWDVDPTTLRGIQANTAIWLDNDNGDMQFISPGGQPGRIIRRIPEIGAVISEGDMIREPMGAEASVQQLLRTGYVDLGMIDRVSQRAAVMRRVTRDSIIVDEIVDIDQNQVNEIINGTLRGMHASWESEALTPAPVQQTAAEIRAIVDAAHGRFMERFGRPVANLMGVEHFINHAPRAGLTAEMLDEALRTLTHRHENGGNVGRQDQTPEGEQPRT